MRTRIKSSRLSRETSESRVCFSGVRHAGQSEDEQHGGRRGPHEAHDVDSESRCRRTSWRWFVSDSSRRQAAGAASSAAWRPRISRAPAPHRRPRSPRSCRRRLSAHVPRAATGRHRSRRWLPGRSEAGGDSHRETPGPPRRPARIAPKVFRKIAVIEPGKARGLDGGFTVNGRELDRVEQLQPVDGLREVPVHAGRQAALAIARSSRARSSRRCGGGRRSCARAAGWRRSLRARPFPASGRPSARRRTPSARARRAPRGRCWRR